METWQLWGSLCQNRYSALLLIFSRVAHSSVYLANFYSMMVLGCPLSCHPEQNCGIVSRGSLLEGCQALLPSYLCHACFTIKQQKLVGSACQCHPWRGTPGPRHTLPSAAKAMCTPPRGWPPLTITVLYLSGLAHHYLQPWPCMIMKLTYSYLLLQKIAYCYSIVIIMARLSWAVSSLSKERLQHQ